MSPSVNAPEAIWKSFLRLGEELLNQPDTISTMNLLNQRVSAQFHCEARLFPVEPSYPLPGEEPVLTLPSARSPELVEKAYHERKKQKKSTSSHDPEVYEIALLLQTQETLLAILWVSRPPKEPFTNSEIELLEGLVSYVAVSMQVNRQVVLKNWRFDQIALVRSVSSQIATVLDLNELCKRVTRLIQSSFGYYFVSIFTLEPGTDTLNFRASAGEKDSEKSKIRLDLKIGSGMIGSTALSGQEHVAKDVAEDPYFQSIDILPETKAEATIPLIVESRILGVLDIQSCQHESFHENDMLVLRSLADNIALAVESARLYNGIEKRAERLNAVLEINSAISTILDLDTLLKEIVKRIQTRFNYPFVQIFTVHPGRRKVIYQTGSGKRSKYLHTNSYAFELDAPRGLIPYVARTGKPMLVNDVEQHPLYLPSKLPPHNTRSELTIPLIFGSEVLGILDLQSDVANSFTQEDLDLFEGLASVIAVSLRNATLFRTERWRREVADSFQDVAKLLSENIELPTLLDTILTELEKILPCDASAIWLLEQPEMDPSKFGQLHLAASHGVSEKLVTKTLAESDEIKSFLNASLQENKPSIRKPGGPFGPLGKACNFPENYSSVSVPLRAGDTVLGSLTLAHHLEGRYGTETSAISATFANYAAMAIQNARLFASAQQEAWSSTVMLQVAEACQSIASEDELLSTMTRLAPLLVGIDQCCIYLYDQQQSVFMMKSWYGFNPNPEELSIQELDALPFLKLITTQSPVFINNPAEELKLLSLCHSPEESTIVLLPMIARGELLGAFLVSHRIEGEIVVENKFSDQTLAILQGLTQQTAVALENIHLVETRQEEAYITAVLLQVAQAVVSQSNLTDILDTIVQLMPILVGIETCVIYLCDKSTQKFTPAQAIAENRDLRDWLRQKSYMPGEYSLLDEILKNPKMAVCQLESPELSPDKWQEIDCLSFVDEDMEILKSGKNWLLGFPLTIKGDFYGALVVVERDVPSKFQAKRIELLNGVSQQISLAIQDDSLNQEVIIRERMEKEIQLARQIQKTFLPESLPQIKGWNLDLRWNTAREVGGDFYDVFFTLNHKLALVIADVSDKGMPAALYMTVTRTLIRSSAQSLHSPARILARVNELLVSDNPSNGMFVTAVFAVLDPVTGQLNYAIAGHNLPLLYRNDTHQLHSLNKGGSALGVIENAEYDDHATILNQGDTLLFYTDGVTETFSPDEEQFSESGLRKVLTEALQQKKKNVLQFIEEELAKFRASPVLTDDVTMIRIQREKKDPA
jgi:phosphoserine phosphatase RsbU/P